MESVGRVAERLCRGLQILVRRFDSGPGLQFFSSQSENCVLENENRSPVAQLVERVAVNHFVAGSSPARGAIFLLDTLNTTPHW